MGLFGKTKLSVFANSVVLIGLIFFALGKLGVFHFDVVLDGSTASSFIEVTKGIDYEISKDILNLYSGEELDAALASWELDEDGLKAVLAEPGITIAEFYEHTEISFLKNYSTDMREFYGLFVEVKSSKYSREQLKSAYDFVVFSFKDHAVSFGNL